MELTPADFLSAKIMIVDDITGNIVLLRRILAGAGYTCVTSTTNPFSVCELHREHRYDLILLDLNMPGMNGFELLENLKKIEPDCYVPVLAVTADPNHKLRALQAGAKDFIGKPFDVIEIKTRIHNMLEVRLQHRALQQVVLMQDADLQRFRKAMEATADAIFLLNRTSMRFMDVNNTACRMFGYTREELLLLGPRDLLNTTPQALELGYDKIIATGQSDRVELLSRRKNGSEFAAELTRCAQRMGDDWVIIAILRDITERNEAKRQLLHLAHYDILTELPNRTLFYETLSHTLNITKQQQQCCLVMFIDLDNFKNINDTLGHTAGDELLRQFGNRLRQFIPARDTVARFGGDEFALILNISDKKNTVDAVNKIHEIVHAPFNLNNYEVSITASSGITFFPDDATDPETLIKYADTAMHRAKAAGRDSYRFFTADMNTGVLARLALENALHKAIDNNEFVLHYQPKVQISTGQIIGVEALIRWMRPEHGMVPPGDFIPLLEETGLIVRVGSWVIETACAQLAKWKLNKAKPIHISVNVSSRQFVGGDLEAVVVNAIRTNDIEPDFLELELTESSLMTNAEKTITVLHRLKAIGVQISIDDFGTGYSSLAYLKRFPIDRLKIDIAFIRDIATNPDDAAITLAIINMAHSLKMQVTAEGVETEAQLAYLRHHGCDEMQGFYFSRPVPLVELEEMLNKSKCLSLIDEGFSTNANH